MDRNQQLSQAMELYGIKTKIVNGKEYIDTGFVDFENVMQISDFRVLSEGCETWIAGERLPVRGCFNQKTVTVHQFKKIFTTLVNTLSGNIFKKIIGVIYLKSNWQHFVDFAHAGMRNVFMERKFYQQPVREVYDVLNKIDTKVRDIVCAVLEFDDAYRYRFQDIISLINKVAFQIDPFQEIRRLLAIYLAREEPGAMDMKLVRAINWLILYLKFNPKLLKQIREIVWQINLEEIAFSPEDIYWTNKLGKYMYRGLTIEDRQKLNV